MASPRMDGSMHILPVYERYLLCGYRLCVMFPARTGWTWVFLLSLKQLAQRVLLRKRTERGAMETVCGWSGMRDWGRQTSCWRCIMTRRVKVQIHICHTRPNIATCQPQFHPPYFVCYDTATMTINNIQNKQNISVVRVILRTKSISPRLYFLLVYLPCHY